MSVKMKITPESVINRGAKTITESTDDDDIRFTLRIPKQLIDQIDEQRKTKIGKISRNHWILLAIADKLEDKNGHTT